MNSKRIDQLVSVILFHDMECVLTREIVMASVEGKSYFETVASLERWASTLVENAEFVTSDEWRELG